MLTTNCATNNTNNHLVKVISVSTQQPHLASFDLTNLDRFHVVVVVEQFVVIRASSVPAHNSVTATYGFNNYTNDH